MVADLEVLHLHYAETLRCWRARFQIKRDDAQQFDERFCRMWEFYLCVSEMAFRYRRNMVLQLQLTKKVDQLPLTRTYLYRAAANAAMSVCPKAPARSPENVGYGPILTGERVSRRRWRRAVRSYRATI